MCKTKYLCICLMHLASMPDMGTDVRGYLHGWVYHDNSARQFPWYNGNSTDVSILWRLATPTQLHRQATQLYRSRRNEVACSFFFVRCLCSVRFFCRVERRVSLDTRQARSISWRYRRVTWHVATYHSSCHSEAITAIHSPVEMAP